MEQLKIILASIKADLESIKDRVEDEIKDGVFDDLLEGEPEADRTFDSVADTVMSWENRDDFISFDIGAYKILEAYAEKIDKILYPVIKR